ncbi:hypothetical protein SAMN05444397_101417 [Flavobacterium aquidurense]|uniref:Lipoprotein n=1 Tax=Flavobacterium frigidimaris TaxID=262320 RepID=A0ABX4BLE8_FLAFR|nr:DUF6452 family protein [Flavobacterium frigidimaris]OXA76092.1 hypothetical protein B0A65_19760 [Flavobacterium frigidimaris]SDY35248.1 hypothetical protein SAMN05444397_101417 [Flavobacterium aquidurense]
MKKIISFLLVFTFGLSSCEKDDICDPDTPTTPRLVITFYDINNPTLLKNVTNLKVIGQDKSEVNGGIIFNESGDETTKYLANGSTISIPLKTNAESTTFTFISDSQNPNPAAINKDAIRFNYTHQDIYVSRACGFKTTFTLNPVSSSPPVSIPFVLTDADGNGLWMQQVFVINPKIETENETHIKVFF